MATGVYCEASVKHPTTLMIHSPQGAEEDRFHGVALTNIKVANVPHLLPYPL